MTDQLQPVLSEAALAYGNQSATRLLTKGRVERHLGRAELSVLIALAYEAGAKALLKAQEGV